MYTTKCKGKPNSKQNATNWTCSELERKAFNDLKLCFTTSPILAYPEFVVHTDASFDGFGAVLYQNIDCKDRVISYASRAL